MTRAGYKRVLYPRKEVQQLRDISEYLKASVETLREDEIPKDKRKEIPRRKDDAIAVAKEAWELAKEIEKYDTWRECALLYEPKSPVQADMLLLSKDSLAMDWRSRPLDSYYHDQWNYRHNL